MALERLRPCADSVARSAVESTLRSILPGASSPRTRIPGCDGSNVMSNPTVAPEPAMTRTGIVVSDADESMVSALVAGSTAQVAGSPPPCDEVGERAKTIRVYSSFLQVVQDCSANTRRRLTPPRLEIRARAIPHLRHLSHHPRVSAANAEVARAQLPYVRDVASAALTNFRVVSPPGHLWILTCLTPRPVVKRPVCSNRFVVSDRQPSEKGH